MGDQILRAFYGTHDTFVITDSDAFKMHRTVFKSWGQFA
jgi:hypothetical protein